MMQMRRTGLVLMILLAPVLLVIADEHGDKDKKTDKKMPARVQKAVCQIRGLGKNKVHGQVVFRKKGTQIEISGKISGLTPGKHGFHIHEFGDCTSADGLSAGGHFDPDGMPHGGPHSKKRHVGDLGNITANDKGVAEFKYMDKMIKLSGPHSIIGRSVIVHAKEDNLKEITSAGPRIGGGVIGIAKSNAKK